MKILVLGGYGVFGGRLIELLSDLPQIEMIVAGRNLARAEKYCAAFSGQAKVRALQLDRNDIAEELVAEQPDLVVDASGPFQEYGDHGYLVIEACIKHRVNYLDFADAADFVFGVSQLDRAARDAGVFALSGVSSFPVLTAAVLSEMSKSMDVLSVTGGIAPSPFAGIGLNVMRAVVGYAGAPVQLTQNGQQTTVPGLTQSMRYTIAVPGKLPLANIRFSLVDVPDLQILPSEFPQLRDIWMGAGPVPESLHRVLNLLAKARAKLNLPSFTPLAPLFYAVLNLAKFGEHRGGMFVHATGVRDGVPHERSWHLLAEGDDGPYIPSMAIEAIVRKHIAQDVPAPGARPATITLTLEDYERLFEGRTITTGFREEPSPNAPLYRQVLGDAFDSLPSQIRALHDDCQARSWTGSARVQRGTGALSRALGWMLGFPPGAENTPVTVQFDPIEGGETWRRTFGSRSFSSTQTRGSGRNDHLLLERFGPIAVALALVVQDNKLYLVPRRWTFCGLPMPKALLPDGKSFEAQVDGKFHFNVEISAPLVGLIAAYQGELEPSSCPISR
ncbi:MAG: DUF4166 domain-containing protein [Roseovarius sp.]|nr:DUF4166 domain-containing protein [Roseovarius sp.]